MRTTLKRAERGDHLMEWSTDVVHEVLWAGSDHFTLQCDGAYRSRGMNRVVDAPVDCIACLALSHEP